MKLIFCFLPCGLAFACGMFWSGCEGGIAGCLVDIDCPASQICDQGKCVNNDCLGGCPIGQYCSGTLCTICQDDWHCGEKCINCKGAARNKVCRMGVCGCINADDCNQGENCVEGKCQNLALCGNGQIDPGETCNEPILSPCPVSCDDGNPCTSDLLTGSAQNCNANCSYSAMSQCLSGDGCCPSNCASGSDADCSAFCGNGTVDPGETCGEPSLPSCPVSCDDDNPCTSDLLTGSAQNCNANCSYSAIGQCQDGDDCCPSNCSSGTDSDCSAFCGNGTVDPGETCGEPSLPSCPVSCDDGNPCTSDLLTGSAQNCNAACSHSNITQCQSGDGCCPAGCECTDSDCPSHCDNNIQDCGETDIDCGGDCIACNNYLGDLSAKYGEEVVLVVDDPSELLGYFDQDHYNVQTGPLPSCINFNAGTVTINNYCGVVVSNPLVQSPFYKIEVELVDAGQQSLTAFLTGVDTLWSHSVPSHGLSMGIDTTKTKTAYWYTHTQLSTSGLSQDQINFSNAAQSRFAKRTQGAVLLEMYVTPIGTYVVINGANTMSFPNLYTGSTVYDQQQNAINFLTLAKWNSGADPVTFKNLRFIRLDPDIQSVHEVNAYFIKRTVESAYFQQAVASPDTPYADNLWLAFLYRGLDYYYKTHHQAEVQTLVDRYIAGLAAYIDSGISQYGQVSTVGLNHWFINTMQSQPFVVYALSAYLTTNQKEAIRQQFARVIDKSMEYIRTDGECRFETHNYLPNGSGQYDEEVTYKGVRYRWRWDTSHNHPVAEAPLDLTQISRYVGTSAQPGPCYGLGAGLCRLSTRTYYPYNDGSGQKGESITANNRAYNYYADGSPWPNPNFGFYLYDVPRYQTGPCAGHSQNDCDFETRTYVNMSNGDQVESITAYGKGYNFTYNTTTHVWDPWSSNGFDLATTPQYSQPYGPCDGRPAGDCHFDTREWRSDPDGDTITAYGNVYRFDAGEHPKPGYDNLSFCEWYADGEVACRYREGPCRFIFPQRDGYIGDTFAEEISWLMAYYTGYLVHFSTDHPRVDKLREYITFLGFHHLSDAKSIRQVYGNAIQFSYLGQDYLDFTSRYMWDDGSIDNHDFHPSLNYSQGAIGQAAVVRNVLAKNQISVPTISYNIDRAYNTNIVEHLDIQRFKHKTYVPILNRSTWTFDIFQDSYAFSADQGSINDFSGRTMPSLLEDWGGAFSSYHIIENFGDTGRALEFARNVYYGFYTGTGKLFCGHTAPNPCSVSTSSFWNFTFGDALYALLFSMQSNFDPRRL